MEIHVGLETAGTYGVAGTFGDSDWNFFSLKIR
jgi:hypothetical protein